MHFQFPKEEYLRVLRILCSFFISFYRNFHSKIFNKYSHFSSPFIAYGRSFLNDSIDFIPVFVHNGKKNYLFEIPFVAEFGPTKG